MKAKSEVIISRFAEEDLHEIIEYYYQISIPYTEKVVNEFEKNINQLKCFPKIGRVVPELEKQGIIKYRELLQGYYRIVYEEIDGKKVVIHTIIDGRRNFEDIIISKLMRYCDNK
jgi:plasmid stabilization system protein ParE